MSESTVWPLEPHTRAKHEILKRYLLGWFPILASGGRNTRLIFLDGFAGPGRYSEGEPGSPIIALDCLVNHSAFHRLGDTEFVMIFVEQDRDRFMSLEAEIEGFWAAHPGGRPNNVNVRTIRGTFADTAGSILDRLEDTGKQLAPTFAFIDPFGFKGVPMETVARLMRYRKCEVFFNFMYDQLNRWVTHPDDVIHQHLRELFGCSDYREADGMSPSDRRAFLHGLYQRQLRTAAGCDYVQPFEMRNRKHRPIYSLFFGSCSLKGLEVMKDAMWGLDPSAGIGYSDYLAGEQVLFQPEPDFRPLRDGILREFAGRTVRVDEIHRYVLAETPYRASHYKVQVLKPLQAEGLIQPVSGQRRAGTFPDGTVLTFALIC